MAYPIRTLAQLPLILRGFRKQRQLTQAALAAQLGMSQQSYAQIEANPAVVSVERLVRVLQALQVGLVLAPKDAGLPAAEVDFNPPRQDPQAAPPSSAPPSPAQLPRRKKSKGKLVAPKVDADAMARILRENW